MDVIAIIPARGNSKRLPRKNDLPLGGDPLFVWSLRAAQQCPLIRETYLSTEDEKIHALALHQGVQVLKRPLELAEDHIQCRDVVRQILMQELESDALPDYVALLQPTSPFRNATHLTEALMQLRENPKANSCVSVCDVEHHPARCVRLKQGILEPYTASHHREQRTQELEKLYRQNGALYIVKTSEFLKQQSFIVDPCIPYFMNQTVSLDIDSDYDYAHAVYLLQRHPELLHFAHTEVIA